MSVESGRLGIDSPVLGMVQFSASSERSLGGVSIPLDDAAASSRELGSISLCGSGGDKSGREFVNRNSSNRHTAFTTSSSTMTRHRTFSPFRFAAISHNSSVYCIIWRTRARRLYVGDFWVQNLVYLLCGVCGCRRVPGICATAFARRESWYNESNWTPLCTAVR
jgi:hypothetical protein